MFLGRSAATTRQIGSARPRMVSKRQSTPCPCSAMCSLTPFTSTKRWVSELSTRTSLKLGERARADDHLDSERAPHRSGPRPAPSVRRRRRLVLRIGGGARDFHLGSGFSARLGRARLCHAPAVASRRRREAGGSAAGARQPKLSSRSRGGPSVALGPTAVARSRGHAGLSV
jgi:hypothetical protein